MSDYINKVIKGEDTRDIHDLRIPELTGEEGYCVPFVNEAGTAFQIGSIPSACLDTGSVITEKVANSAITTEKINDGAVTEVKLNKEVLNKMPYGASSEFAHGVQRVNYHVISAVSEPNDGEEGNYELNDLEMQHYDTHKQIFLDSVPTFVVLRCNILGIVGTHATRLYGSHLVLNEVSRTIPTDDTSNLYDIVFEGVYGGFKYTFQEVFQHTVWDSPTSSHIVPNSYSCKREFITETSDIADGAITTEKIADNAVTAAKLSVDLRNQVENGYTKLLTSSDFQSGWNSGFGDDYLPIIEDNSYHRYITTSPFYYLAVGDYVDITSPNIEVSLQYYTEPHTSGVKVSEWAKLPAGSTFEITQAGWYGVSARKSSSGPAISPSEFDGVVKFYGTNLTSDVRGATRISDKDLYPDIDMEIKGFSAGVNPRIYNGKLIYESSSIRGASPLFTIPDGYNYMILENAHGYACCMHEVYNRADLSASTVVTWNRPGNIVKVSHNSYYVVQGAMRNVDTALTLPDSGVLCTIHLFHDMPNPQFTPTYDTYKAPQSETLYEILRASGFKQVQGCGFGGGKLLICTPGTSGSNDGKMQLFDVYTNEMVKSVSFSGGTYGHMNDVAYRDGLWYIPYYNADGVAQDKCFVFDSTLTSPTELPLLNDEGNAYACWRFCYNKLTDEFYAATRTDYTFLVYDANLTYKRTITLDGSTTITGDAKTYMQGCETDGTYLYICNTSNNFNFNYITVHSLADGKFVGSINIPISGNELEGLGYDWDTGLMYILWFARPSSGYRGCTIQRVNFFTEPNIPKLLNYMKTLIEELRPNE